MTSRTFSFYILLISYFLCDVSYVFLSFSALDELVVILIMLFYFFVNINNKKKNYPVRLYCFFVLFYVAYTCFSKENIKVKAILLDVVQESKFIVPFLCLYYFKPILNDKQKRILKKCAIFIAIFSTFLFFVDVGRYFSHVGYYGNVMLSTSLLYLFCSKKKKVDIFVTVLIVLMGLICTRSKYFGEITFFIIMLLFIKSQIKFNFKYLLLGILSISLAVIFSWTKFSYYFLSDYSDSTEARTVLYYTSTKIFEDYFPFGTGYGTYGNDASRKYYSPLYSKYGINSIYGLSEDMNDFVADTYFPVVIAQFNIVGIFLFLYFMIYIIRLLNDKIRDNNNYYNYLIGIEIIVVIIIESIAGPLFVSSQAIFYSILLAYSLNDNYVILKHAK